MPLLEARCPLEYTVEFVRPQVTESDYVWDNFQDQVVIQTRLSKLVVKLQAFKASSTSEAQVINTPEVTSFFPRSLPEVKAPSLKLFEYIEKNHRVASTEKSATRRPERVSESFNGSKKKSESSLAPLRTPADKQLVSLPAISSSRPSSSERTRTPPSSIRPMSGSNSTKSEFPAVSSTAAEVSNQMEAKAIILKLRARNSTRSGASDSLSVSLQTTHGSESSLEEPFPESRLDVKTKAELDDFNHLVVSVKEGVKRDQASAKSELDYYRQFLPRAPSDVVTPRDITPRETIVASSSLKPLTTPVDLSATAGFAAKAVPPSNSIALARKAKLLPVIKVPAKLPTLSALSSLPQTTTSMSRYSSSTSSLEGESNQETSPVRVSSTVSGATGAAKKVRDLPRVTQVARSAASSQPQKAATGMTATKSSVYVARTKAGGPSETSSSASNKPTPSASQQQIETRASVKTHNPPSAKKPTATSSTKKKPNQQPQVATKRDPEAALSDFDDPDPEVDDAPILPDDLSGMRATYCCGDGDDEY